jgi:hypothetical protein
MVLCHLEVRRDRLPQGGLNPPILQARGDVAQGNVANLRTGYRNASNRHLFDVSLSAAALNLAANRLDGDAGKPSLARGKRAGSHLVAGKRYSLAGRVDVDFIYCAAAYPRSRDRQFV